MKKSTSSVRKRTIAAKVVISDTRKRIHESSKDLSTQELNFRVSLARQNVEDLEGQVTVAQAELQEAKKTLVDAKDTVAALEALLESRR